MGQQKQPSPFHDFRQSFKRFLDSAKEKQGNSDVIAGSGISWDDVISKVKQGYLNKEAQLKDYNANQATVGKAQMEAKRLNRPLDERTLAMQRQLDLQTANQYTDMLGMRTLAKKAVPAITRAGLPVVQDGIEALKRVGDDAKAGFYDTKQLDSLSREMLDPNTPPARANEIEKILKQVEAKQNTAPQGTYYHGTSQEIAPYVDKRNLTEEQLRKLSPEYEWKGDRSGKGLYVTQHKDVAEKYAHSNYSNPQVLEFLGSKAKVLKVSDNYADAKWKSFETKAKQAFPNLPSEDAITAYGKKLGFDGLDFGKDEGILVLNQKAFSRVAQQPTPNAGLSDIAKKYRNSDEAFADPAFKKAIFQLQDSNPAYANKSFAEIYEELTPNVTKTEFNQNAYRVTRNLESEFGVKVSKAGEMPRGLTGKDVDTLLYVDDLSKLEGKRFMPGWVGDKPLDVVVTDGKRYLVSEDVGNDFARFTETPQSLNGKKFILGEDKLRQTKLDEYKPRVAQPSKVDADPLPQILRGSRGLTADDIMETHPNIQLTRDVPAKDIYGNKVEIPEGEKLTPYELKGNKVLLQDGEAYVVSKNQFQNIKGQSIGGEPKPFAPELEGLEETVMGGAIKETPQMKAKKTLDDAGYQVDQDMDGSAILLDRNGEYAEYDALPDPIRKALDTYLGSAETFKEIDELPTRYSSYTLPDGENYREILIRAKNDSIANMEKAGWRFEDKGNGEVDLITPDGVNQGRYGSKESASRSMDRDYGGFKSSHWDDKNVISHLRMNDRTYNGKKVAFMEELQSDWAREAREKGTSLDKKLEWNPQPSGDLRATLGNREFVITKEGSKAYVYEQNGLLGQTVDSIETAKKMAQEHAGKGAIPNHPLLKNWQEPTIKRALKDAVDSDAEYFSWINGEQTSARYNLATHVKNVIWKPQGKLRHIRVEAKQGISPDMLVDKTGKITSADRGWQGKKLDEVLGKGLADKIMEKESGTLSGEGLKFGGEWANNLYDKQVGDIVRKLTGGKIETIDMGLPIVSKKTLNVATDSMVTKEILSKDNVKVGQMFAGENRTRYIITDVLDDGKFNAVEKDFYDSMKGRWLDMEKDKNWLSRLEGSKETFDISQKTTTQQAIRLTPEIKAKIKGEAPVIQTSGKKFEAGAYGLVPFAGLGLMRQLEEEEPLPPSAMFKQRRNQFRSQL